MNKHHEKINIYLQILEKLDDQNLSRLTELLTHNVIFSDPFNQTNGIPRFIKAISSVLEDTRDHSFQINQKAEFEFGVMITWTLKMTPKHWIFKNQQIQIEGSSSILTDDSGFIIAHYDYWDTASTLYEKIPILGLALSKIRKKLEIK
ncbi:MAG TPA: nuclear transport factor 2 family protein [Oligoflexia bacterium]|nr:nuclear transport factor 2 family protein [Oligoflexia bacterium]HMP49701.1 nuclear transport factor 2 family protein [Oligoflexia bacterium]